ncbi:MAG TPA: hypothetical protein VGF86_03930 [Candidatus Tumulicola sp.]|jgi:hypothetical protein
MSNRAFAIFLALATAAWLTACGPPQSTQPFSGTHLGTNLGPARFGPNAKTNGDLIYVSDLNAFTVSVYSFSGEFLGLLTGLAQPDGMCTDATGNVYIVDFQSAVIKAYAHNSGVAFKTLKDPNFTPTSCGIDPKSGDLAVTNDGNGTGGSGNVAIYTKAKGNPKFYSGSNVDAPFFCGYDDKGNLFVDGGTANSSVIGLAELPAGQAALKDLKLKPKLQFPGDIAWDGNYVDVADAGSGIIYSITVSGSSASVKRKIELAGGLPIFEYAFVGSELIGAAVETASPATGDVAVWRYPGGGFPARRFGSLALPFGVAVSVPPPH